jgi:mannose-1-phosphate guanylyltransferase
MPGSPAHAILKHKCETATMIVLTADQVIEPAGLFNAAIVNAANFLEIHPEILICFGVEATSPNTLAGWQKLGESLDFSDCDVRKIVDFIEKPDLDIAQRYMEGGGYGLHNHCS